MLAACLEGGQAVKQAGSHWKQSPLEVQLGKYLQLQFQIVPAHPEMNLGFSVIKSKPFYNMKQKKFAKMEKNLWCGGNCTNLYPLNSETVGIQTCGEIPMDINLFLGHWKDSRKYKIEKVEDRKSRNRAFKTRITGTNTVFFLPIISGYSKLVCLISLKIMSLCNLLICWSHCFAREKAVGKHLTLCHD